MDLLKIKKWIFENVIEHDLTKSEMKLDYNTDGDLGVIHFEIQKISFIGDVRIWENGDICLIKIELPSGVNETKNIVVKDENEIINLLNGFLNV